MINSDLSRYLSINVKLNKKNYLHNSFTDSTNASILS